ncbi:MAG: hypothetical protein JW751_28880 [Polyangiaceae bacterium]|nr:hypothetical protein [Polyangiaceae bacterium]
MAAYYVVLDPTAAGAFVAGFGDLALAVAFAVEEASERRPLTVVCSETGERVYPTAGDKKTGTPPRTSLMRARGPLGTGEE